jgi:hypothetical protein
MRAVGFSMGPFLIAVAVLDVPLYLRIVPSRVYLAVLGAAALHFMATSGLALARTHQISTWRGYLVALLPALVLVTVTVARAATELPELPLMPEPASPYFVP